jgi:hypothetical protein
MKSYIQMFSELYYALAKDICAQYPSIKSEMDRDLSRLHSALAEEGLSFITITHLDMCNFFQKSLADEALVDLAIKSRPRGFGRKSSSDARPRYLWGLVSLVFAEDGTLKSDPDVTAISFVRQWLLMAKKLEVDCSDDRKEATLSEFLAVEASMPDHHPSTWDHDDPLWARRVYHPLWGRSILPAAQLQLGFSELDRADGLDWDLYRTVCDRIRSEIGVFDPWSCRPKHGPGAVADPGQPVKYNFTSWPAKLQQYFPWDFFATSDFGVYRTDTSTEPDTREHPAVVLCVPKTQKGPRIICKEPIANQWMQGAVERFLVDRVHRTALRNSINFRDQDPSQELAVRASLKGEWATVDLSAASDRISTRLVEYLFGGGSDTSILDALHATRSRWFVLRGHHRFRKFAPMGSACTFPVQSILFLSFALFAVLATRRMQAKDWLDVLPEIRVFGDDIIIPTDSIEVLYKALTTCGLKVNESKSYSTGLFRESCGMDAYAGWDVTPAYIKHLYSSSRPSSLQAVVDIANNFFEKGYWNVAAALLKTVPPAERKLLPVKMYSKKDASSRGSPRDGAVSLSSYCGDDYSHLSSRFNENLHRLEHSAIVLKSKQVLEQGDGAAGLIQFFYEEPDPETCYKSGQVRRVTSRKTRDWV